MSTGAGKEQEEEQSLESVLCCWASLRLVVIIGASTRLMHLHPRRREVTLDLACRSFS